MKAGISAPFIRFPVATTLIMVGILFLGMVAYPLLGVAPLPQVDFPTIQVTAQLPGSLTRIFAAVQDLKNGHKLTDDIARELGILAGETAVPHLAALQPVLVLTVSGGKVEVKWGWNGHGASLDACEIQVDRGDGKGFNLLTIDTTPGYTDTQPFPAGKAAWTYKAIYRVDDQQVGQWSQPVSVAVGA